MTYSSISPAQYELIPDELANWLKKRTPTYKEWRHTLHAHPELAFEEYKTAKFVADKLKKMGLEVYEGLAKTGVVAVLRCGGSEAELGPKLDYVQILMPYRSPNREPLHISLVRME